jgi:glycosyltransferase involved in cell wall biosynthesis
VLIGIDASRAVADRPTGTEIYSQRVIQALLSSSAGSDHYRLYFRETPPRGLFPHAEHRVIPFPRLWTHARLSWEVAWHPPDVLFIPAHVIPLLHPRRTIVTVHDLGYLYFPAAHPWQQRVYLDLSTRWNARVAAHVLVDSEITQRDLVARYGVPADKITVAYPGVDPALAPVRDPDRIAAVRARYGIAGPYFLYLGTLQPRKNLARLIEAYALWRERHAVDPAPQLVLAGKRGWLYAALFEQVERLGLAGQVVFPGYVPEAEKPALLSGALAFLFPSLYEGFGLPVLEAQACGCPVVASTTSSLPEVAGEAALLVDPVDVGAIVRALARLADDVALRRRLVAQGRENVKRFSWQRCGRVVADVIGRVAQRE